MTGIISLDKNLPPRYFIVHKDCSAEELLREEDYSECLKEAEKDPMVAVLRPPVKNDDGATAITILKPFGGKCCEGTSSPAINV